LVERGHIASITVCFRPTGTSVVGRAGAALIKSGLDKDTDYPVGVLIETARSLDLVGRKAKSGVRADGGQELPKKSLCDRDFSEEALPRLQQRCNTVAEAAGGGVLIGRVRSAGKFAGKVTTSFQDWWRTAPPQDRLLSLADARNRGKITPEMFAAMANLQCPFRGTLEFVVAEEEEGSGGEEGPGAGPSKPPKKGGK
jgi:hypothetical protein